MYFRLLCPWWRVGVLTFVCDLRVVTVGRCLVLLPLMPLPSPPLTGVPRRGRVGDGKRLLLDLWYVWHLLRRLLLRWCPRPSVPGPPFTRELLLNWYLLISDWRRWCPYTRLLRDNLGLVPIAVRGGLVSRGYHSGSEAVAELGPQVRLGSAHVDDDRGRCSWNRFLPTDG